MAQEIERKFLVMDDAWRHHVKSSSYYRQGYLANTGKCSVRIRVADEKGFLNIKSATLDITRTEYEYPVPLQEAQAMLNDFCEGSVVEKTRYFVDHGGFTWEVDVFDGENRGLIMAEIELTDKDADFPPPPWIGAEVSDDPRYYNVYLAFHPYTEW